jgi:tetratricopeptide (TPR) repeat protein
MSDDIFKKIKKTRSHEKEERFERAVKMYKGLTALFPDKNEYWYLLGISLLKMGKNNDGFKALATAKRLGSEKALKKILLIIDQFKLDNPKRGELIKNLLLGEGAGNV